MENNKKITKATFKSFIKKNEGKLHIDVESSFDGTIDGLRHNDEGFSPVVATYQSIEHTYGIAGAWLVGRGNDYFREFDTAGYAGIHIHNACGSFTVAIKKELAA